MWEVRETIKGKVSDFGPFKTLDEALSFAKDQSFPWSEDTLEKIEIVKVCSA